MGSRERFIFFLLIITLHYKLLESKDEHSYECGKSVITRLSRIVGGEQAYPGEFPWTVSIRMNNRHYCGGTLLNERWILTAAHCFAGRVPYIYHIRLGSHKAEIIEPHTVEIPIGNIIIHDNYSIPRPFSNDIALIRLQIPINYTDYIIPICLPSESTQDYKGLKGIVVGWGWTLSDSFQAYDQSATLQKAEVPIISNIKCMEWYKMKKKPVKISLGQFCAGYEKGGKDACRGDSGGPMIIKDNNTSKLNVIGIVSAGIGCALPYLPGLYTKVSNYIPWIQSYINN